MPVPAKHKAKSHSRSGRAHLALKKVILNKCSKCRKPVLPHHACAYCGTYDKREAVKIKTRLDKKSKAKKEKEEKELKKNKE